MALKMVRSPEIRVPNLAVEVAHELRGGTNHSGGPNADKGLGDSQERPERGSAILGNGQVAPR